MKLVYIGNFNAPHSTENHVATAFKAKGHELHKMQEQDVSKWNELIGSVKEFDMVLWTRTASLSNTISDIKKANLLFNCRSNKVPIVSFHLDRFWGIPRQIDVLIDAFFRTDLIITADGGHAKWWRTARVPHLWLPPAVSEPEALRIGKPHANATQSVAFVGSWRNYHQEWPYRRELVEWLQRTYRDKFLLVEGGVRGQDLADLYASVPVIVGDSCLVGGATHYWSDRIPETVGRGGYLIHPDVEGLGLHYIRGEHLETYELGNFEDLHAKIEAALADPDMREYVSTTGRDWVLKNHTYEVRVDQILAGVEQVRDG